jgi:Cu/Ag efflux protein CusF
VISLSRIVIVCALALGAPLAALAQSASVSTTTAKAPDVRMAGGDVQVRAKVIELDKAGRTATLKGPKGRVVTVNVPAEIKNFDQVRVGDELVVRYAAAVAAKLERVAKTGIRERVETTGAVTAASGAMPGTAAGRTVEVLAVIKEVNKKEGSVTLRGATRTVTVRVPESVNIKKLKVGDEVHAMFIEAALLSVEMARP